MLQKIAELLSGYEGRIYQDLEKIVNINSFSTNLAGIRQMHDALQEIAATLDVRLESLFSQEKTRPHLLYGGAAEKDYYAFMGHFDTVHPPESDFNRMWEEEGLLRGPGTNDMKSGLIVALYTLAYCRDSFLTAHSLSKRCSTLMRRSAHLIPKRSCGRSLSGQKPDWSLSPEGCRGTVW